MKELKFKTSKGEFLLVDENELPKIDKIIISNDSSFIRLSEITEEQASEIVDEDNDYGVRIFQNYQTTSIQYFDEQITAIYSLYSLLKSKAIHLYKNPYKDVGKNVDGHNVDAHIAFFEAEQKTFYNPYIFKL